MRVGERKCSIPCQSDALCGWIGKRAAFTDLNARYTEKFGFPFIIAVKDNDKPSILAAFHRRIENDRATEFAEACRQVERIAAHRLRDMLP